MTSRRFTAAAIQLLAHNRSAFADVWPQIVQRIRAAAADGARLIVLPEGTMPAYVLGHKPFEEKEIGAAVEECARLAHELQTVIVIGAARADNGRVYNSALVFDTDGTLKGQADKHFLWHFDRQWFAAGDRLRPVPTSLGTIGVLICADGRIPTIARALVDRGAEMLVMPTAWVTSGRDPHSLENVQADLLARVRARENGVPFVAANKCGVELACVAYCGKSQIIDGTGAVVAIASQNQAETIASVIELQTAPSRRAAAGGAGPIEMHGELARSRIVITTNEKLSADAELPGMLEADLIASPQKPVGATVADDQIFDPAAMAALRLAGAALVSWTTRTHDAMQVEFARARALELRIFVIVFDLASKRSYAVDPDGVIVCGTYDGYEAAAFAFDPARTRQTLVAPGTDVLEGLERAHAHSS